MLPGSLVRPRKIAARYEPSPPRISDPTVNRVKLEPGRTGVIMHGQCLVAVYPSRNEAEQAFRAARGSGIPSNNIRMSSGDMERPHGWDWLFSHHVPERDKTYYRAHLAGGRTALSVLIDDSAPPARIDALEEILDRYHPVDVRVGEEESEEGSTATARGKKVRKGGPAAQAAPKAEEEIIPLPREEAKVSARATDRVHHIRTYVVEEPFDKEVSLSDEQLIVEEREATSGATGDLSGREYEFHERHEEPIVEKTTRADKELAVRKEAKQHTEHVRGTVRKMKAKVEKEEEGEMEEESTGGDEAEKE
jgi:hypothetical protein